MYFIKYSYRVPTGTKIPSHGTVTVKKLAMFRRILFVRVTLGPGSTR